MAKPTEDRFNNFATVYDLKQFLLAKKSRLEKDISERTFSDDKTNVAKGFIRKIDEILRTEYFKATNYNTKIYELMRVLKDDDVIFQKKIGDLEKKITELEDRMKNLEADNADSGYVIPGESEDYNNAIEMKKREIFWRVEGLREELNAYKYRLELCRKLKGIMCRPDGFFASVYK